jgi:hypothetical protein
VYTISQPLASPLMFSKHGVKKIVTRSGLERVQRLSLLPLEALPPLTRSATTEQRPNCDGPIVGEATCNVTQRHRPFLERVLGDEPFLLTGRARYPIELFAGLGSLQVHAAHGRLHLSQCLRFARSYRRDTESLRSRSILSSPRDLLHERCVSRVEKRSVAGS